MPIKKRDGSIGFRPANNETAKWQRSAAKQLKEQWGERPVLNEPVRVKLGFFLPRRKTVVREYPTSRMDGDGDKLDRGVWDSLTDTVLFDDSLVVEWSGYKKYVDFEEEAGVFVTISTMEADDGPPRPNKGACAANTCRCQGCVPTDPCGGGCPSCKKLDCRGDTGA
jgi:Holliday junction resolvase RusA-like endonuclease